MSRKIQSSYIFEKVNHFPRHLTCTCQLACNHCASIFKNSSVWRSQSRLRGPTGQISWSLTDNLEAFPCCQTVQHSNSVKQTQRQLEAWPRMIFASGQTPFCSLKLAEGDGAVHATIFLGAVIIWGSCVWRLHWNPFGDAEPLRQSRPFCATPQHRKTSCGWERRICRRS